MYGLIIMSLLLMLTSESATADYFNTNRSSKIFGAFLTNIAHIDEVTAYSNAFGFAPRNTNEITRFLDANKNKLIPVIKINHLLLNKKTGVYHHNINKIINAIEKSNISDREILFLMDEPLWSIRTECKKKNKTAACMEVENRYIDTIDTLRIAGELLREKFPGSGVIHIEAWAELAIQKKEYPAENVIMLNDAEYLGFDCYGAIDYCGSTEYGFHSHIDYGTWVWETMIAMESHNEIGRKLFLVPGTFLADGYFADDVEIIEQLEVYAWIMHHFNKIGGFGAFLWSDMMEDNKYFIGARNILSVTEYLKDSCTTSPAIAINN